MDPDAATDPAPASPAPSASGTPRRRVRRAFRRPVVAGVAASALAAALAAWAFLAPTTAGPTSVAALTQAQQQLVGAVIREWDDDPESIDDATVASTALATTVEWTPTGGDDEGFVRISGPGLWIEYLTQPGVGISGIRIQEEARDSATTSA